MPEPIKCASCARPFNASFKRCPFCNAPTGAVGTAAPPNPAAPLNALITCRRCARNFNARLGRCPFCNATQEIPPVTGDPPRATSPAAEPGPASPSAAREGPAAAWAPTTTDFTALAEQAMAAHQPFVPLEFHPAAVVSLDAFFDISWGPEGLGRNDDDWQPTERHDSIIVNLGAFFGELMRREFGGTWQADPEQPDNPLAARVVLPDGLQILALSKAWRRLKNGIDDRFEHLYLVVRERQGRTSSPTEIEGWERQAAFFERTGRSDLALELLRRALAIAADATTRSRLSDRIARAEAWLAAARRAEEERAAAPANAPPRSTAEAAPSTDEVARFTRGSDDESEVPSAAPTATMPPDAYPAGGVSASRDELRAPEAVAIPDAALALVEQGAQLTATGQAAEGLALLQQALELAPGYSEALMAIASALLALGRAAEAREWLEFVAIQPRCEPARSFLLGLAADAAGDPVTALQAFRRVLDAPRLSAAERATARDRAAALASDPAVIMDTVSRIEDLEELAAALAHIVEAHPGLTEAWLERGVALSLLDRSDEAFTCFERAAQLAPQAIRSYDHHAVVLGRLHRFEEAIAVLDGGLRACPSSTDLLLRKGVMLTHIDYREEALALFDAAVEHDPSDPRGWAYKGDIEQQLGHPGLAIRSLTRALECQPAPKGKLADVVRRQRWSLENPGRVLDPEQAERALAAAMAGADAGDLDQAKLLLDEALAADPLRAVSWVNAGALLQHLSQFDDALAAYRRADELLPIADTRVEGGIVDCLVALGRGEEALETCDRFLARGPFRVETLRRKARVLVALGHAGDALPIYLRLSARTPNDAALCLERAEALAVIGRDEEATVAFRTAASLAPGDEEIQDRARAGLLRGSPMSGLTA